MKRLLTVFLLLFPLAAQACDALLGVYGVQMEGKGFGEFFNIHRFEQSYVVYANQDGKWELTPNSYLYVPTRDNSWIDKVAIGATPVCAIEMPNGSMFGVYRDQASGQVVFFTYIGSTGQKIVLTKTRNGKPD